MRGRARERAPRLGIALALSLGAHAWAMASAPRAASDVPLRAVGEVHFLSVPSEPVALTVASVASASATAHTTSKVAGAARRMLRRTTVAGLPSGLTGAPREAAADPAEGGAAHSSDVRAAAIAAPTAPVPFAANPAPVYPRVARRAGIEGTVVARVRVSRDGRIAAIDSLAGPEIFHESVREALAHWRYHPATHGGRAVVVAWTLHFPFSLR